MYTIIPASIIIEYNYTNRILHSVAFALLYYDFALTIAQEVERYWTGKLSWPAFLFFLNRYISILGHIPVILEFLGVLQVPESQYHCFISMVIQGVAAALMILRTYALYVRDRRVLSFLLTMIGIGGAISIWVLVVGQLTRRPAVAYAQAFSRTGCVLALSEEEGYTLAVVWSAIMGIDACVFVLTLLRTLNAGRFWDGGFFHLMLRDGTIYFAVLLVCYLSNVLTYTLAEPVHKSVSTTITNVVSTTLITRLMLNIRDPGLRRQGLSGSEFTPTFYHDVA